MTWSARVHRVRVPFRAPFRTAAGTWEVRESWLLRLAAEESQHASRVRLLGARYRQDRRLVASLPIDTPLLDRLLVEAGEALVAVRAGAWDGDARAAMASAAELETRFCQAHAQSLAQGALPELRAFFEQLASQDKAHAALLKG